MYSKEELDNNLKTQCFGRKLFVFDFIDSTNTYAKKLASENAEEGSVVIAEHQTAGRGPFGRTWVSESGSNLLFSLILRPKIKSEQAGLLPLYAATGVALAIEDVSSLQCECKWPNDVIINNKKCCGILIESTFLQNKLEYAILGIGLNINQKSFGDNLDNKATSLSRECGREINRIDLFNHILTSLELLYSEVNNGDFTRVLKEWKSRAAMFGKQVSIIHAGEQIYGRADTLAQDGALVISTSTGNKTFYAGEVTIKNIK